MTSHRAVMSLGIVILLIASYASAAPDSKRTQAALAKEASITMQQAQAAALKKEPGKIKSKELEKEKGKLIYSFDISTSSGIHEVNVDAHTGEVIEDSVESPASEAREKKQDAARSQHKTPPSQ